MMIVDTKLVEDIRAELLTMREEKPSKLYVAETLLMCEGIMQLIRIADLLERLAESAGA